MKIVRTALLVLASSHPDLANEALKELDAHEARIKAIYVNTTEALKALNNAQRSFNQESKK